MAKESKGKNMIRDFFHPCGEDACFTWQAMLRGQLRCLLKGVLLVVILTLLGTLVAHAATGRLYHRVAGGSFPYAVQAGDTLGGIARQYGEPRHALAIENRLDPQSYAAQIYVGQSLTVDNRHIVPDDLENGIVINLAQRRLYRFQAGHLTDDFLIAAGATDAQWQTPTGDFTIKNAVRNPTWFVPRSIQAAMRRQGKPPIGRVPPGPSNPLGKYWIGLSLPDIGIHGTIAPSSIYNFESHGCMRLADVDIQKLFQEVKPGDRGTILYAPVLLATTDDGRIFMEVHEDQYHKGGDPLMAVRELAQANGLSDRIDWRKVAQVIAAQEGVARDISQTAV
jgi:L,D-transpeptidase ErfK/SrfK